MFGKRAKLARRKGTMALELYMVIPLLAFIVVLIFFFGWAMVNQQSVRVSDRYAAWRYIYNDNGSGCSSVAANQYFMQNSAANVTLDYSSGSTQAGQDLTQDAQKCDSSPLGAGVLASDLITNHTSGGCQDVVSAEFPSPPGAALWQRWQGPMQDGYGREGVEWRRTQLGEVQTIKKLYLTDLDNMIPTIPVPGDGMGKMIQNLYSDTSGW
jgi:Flp pilus assembly protein TadG